MFGESKRMYWVSAISAVCLVETFCVKSQTNIASLHLSIRCGISACWSEGGGGRCSGGRTVGAIAQQLLKWHGTKNWTILVFHAFQRWFITRITGSWWFFTNSSQKYVRQIGWLPPQNRGENTKNSFSCQHLDVSHDVETASVISKRRTTWSSTNHAMSFLQHLSDNPPETGRPQLPKKRNVFWFPQV